MNNNDQKNKYKPSLAFFDTYNSNVFTGAGSAGHDHPFQLF
jgi:hypothetical protein